MKERYNPTLLTKKLDYLLTNHDVIKETLSKRDIQMQIKVESFTETIINGNIK